MFDARILPSLVSIRNLIIAFPKMIPLENDVEKYVTCTLPQITE